MKRLIANNRTGTRSPWLAVLLAIALILGGCSLDQGHTGRTGAIGGETPRPLEQLRASTPAPVQAPAPTRSTAPMDLSAPTPSHSALPGTVQEGHFRSLALDSDIHYIVYLPPDYAASGLRYPVIYLLHGRSGRMSDWLQVKSDLDRLIAAGKVPPLIAVLPDAPYNNGASYYVDSGYAGSDTVPAGQRVETAFTRDAIAHIDATYRTIPSREGRAVGGYSMGGWGAARYALAHPDLYRAAIVLSPAVYIPFPPAESGMRALGAFGKGSTLFDDATYTAENYPALIERVVKPSHLPLAMFIAAGDDEHHYERPEDQHHDMDLEAHHLYSAVIRVANMTSELRILQGGHGWDVWQPAFVEGLQYISQFLTTPAP
jgi:enterochelin esterase-like enzyme